MTPSAAAASSRCEPLSAASTPTSAVMAKVRTPAAAGVCLRLHAALALDADQQAGAERHENSRGLRRQSPFIQIERHRGALSPEIVCVCR